MSQLLKLILLNTFVISVLCNFEESIFDDEDIYNQALQPEPHSGLTVPGTKWCGPGNTSSNYNDLGKHRETDICCRDHDHCEEIIEPLTSLNGLSNPDWFPILKCACEQTFINCLQKVNNIVSNTMGRIYFATRNQCFAQGLPIISCKQHQSGTFSKRCILYNVNERKPKKWQFYDMPFFTTNSVNMIHTKLRK